MDHTDIEDCIRELVNRHPDKEVDWWQFQESSEGNVAIMITMRRKGKKRKKV